MKILIASSAPPDRGSGISTYSREISAGFKRLGHEVVYASPRPEEYSWLERNTCGFIETPFEKNMGKLVKQVLEALASNNIDAVINNDNAVIQNIAPFVTCPFISVGHMDSTTIGKMLLHNKQWLDYIVAISSDMQVNLEKKLQLPSYKIPLIHNGVSDNQTKIIKKERSDNKLRVIFGGGLIPIKGSSIVIAILRRAKHEKNIDFEIFGELPNGVPSEFENIPHFKFHGRKPRDEFLEALANSDVFLLPSRAEGCPMALLEAMSFGCIPIVSNGTGAMRWIVVNAENGYVCRLDSWAKNAFETIKYLSGNNLELYRLSVSARQAYEEGFQVEHTVNRLLRLLENPVVDRKVLPEKANLIHWHRWPNSSIKQRILYRLGIIESFGMFRA